MMQSRGLSPANCLSMRSRRSTVNSSRFGPRVFAIASVQSVALYAAIKSLYPLSPEIHSEP